MKKARKPRIVIFPYNINSESAKALQQEIITRGIRCIRVKKDSRTFRVRKSDLLLNLGEHEVPDWAYSVELANYGLLNELRSVAIARNKLLTFQALQAANVSIPEFTVSHDTAFDWLTEGIPFLGRRSVTASKGIGIQDYFPEECEDNSRRTFDLNPCPLYVKYIKKAAEYRVHVFRGEIIKIQQKLKRRDFDESQRDTRIRNLSNGYIYGTPNKEIPPDVFGQGLAAVAALGLDFGAVDVIWNRHHNRAYVLEINTAPGLEGSTVTAYVNAIFKVFNHE